MGPGRRGEATLPEWAEARGYEKYLGSSTKGEAAIDWSDRKARAALLTEIVADADRLLSVHDPELRHGHKAAIVVDTDSQLITAVDVLPGNAPDNLGALELVEQSEASTGSVVEEAMGDAAYGDGGTRQTFADAGRRLVANAPGRPNRSHFPKHDFHLDLAAGSCACPAEQVTHTIVPTGKRTDRAGRAYRLQAFQFDGAECRVCPLRSQCIAAQGRKGRRVQIHPQEILLQQARALQRSAAYDEYRKRRVVAEHRLARLVQLGIRQARYFGRVKNDSSCIWRPRWPT